MKKILLSLALVLPLIANAQKFGQRVADIGGVCCGRVGYRSAG